MKNLIYTTILFFGFGIVSIQGQDVSFTNTVLSAPQNGSEYGKACFTIIAEEGIDLSGVPVAVEVSFSKVDFNNDGINGFNSEKFVWDNDEFAQNVIRGTLTADIPSVENGGGGALVCIPVKRDNPEDYNDPRNGFVVNLLPGSHNQYGNTGNDYIEKFGFPSGSQNSYTTQSESDAEAKLRNNAMIDMEISVYPNPTIDFVNIKITNSNQNNSLKVYNSIGQTLYQGNCEDMTSINTSQWVEGMYFVEITDEQSNVVSKEKLVVSK